MKMKTITQPLLRLSPCGALLKLPILIRNTFTQLRLAGYLDEPLGFVESMEPNVEIHRDLELGDRCQDMVEQLNTSRLKKESKVPVVNSSNMLQRITPWRAMYVRTIHTTRPLYSDSGNKFFKEEFEVGSSTITLETGKIALFAQGSAVISFDQTKVLSTITSGNVPETATEFTLQVYYEEKSFTQNLLSSSDSRRVFSAREILCGDLITRSIKPLIPRGLRKKIQVFSCVLSLNGMIDPVIMAINATSAAIMSSGLQWEGPIGAVRIGRILGKLIVNPSMDELCLSDLKLTYVCTKTKVLIVDVEANEISENDMKAALKLANLEALKYIDPQTRLATKVGGKKYYTLFKVSDTVAIHINKILISWPIYSILDEPLYDNVKLQQAIRDIKIYVKSIYEHGEKIVDDIIREMMVTRFLKGRFRLDQRQISEIRHISFEVDHLGTTKFSHGKAQMDCIVQHGVAQSSASLFSLPMKLFIFQNNYHIDGTLVENAFQAVLPSEDDFDYPVYIISKVKVKDGSVLMTGVCSTTMALVENKVPLRDLVAGVSIGLFSNPKTKEYFIISDILDIESDLGDMDFKITGTRHGITAAQLDVKIPGIPLDIILESLEHGREARLQIIDNMEKEMTR